MDLPTVFLVNSEYAFKESEQFSTYDELSQRLNMHTKHDFVYYWRRDSRTVEGAHLKTARPISKKLKYYSVKYACVFGGQKFSTRGRGERSTHNQTKRMNCPAFISLRASKCGQYLQVMQVCNQHNHEISENAIKRTPHYRKLTPEVKEEVLHLMTANIHRNEIIKYVQLRTGIELISKTINNFMLELKAHKKYVTNVAVFERIQRFLEMHKAVLAIDTSHHDNEPLIVTEEEMVNTESSDNVLEPYIDSLIEEEYEPMMEFDSTIEFTEEKYEAEHEHTIDGDRVPDDIIESIQQPLDNLEDEQTRDENRCENCKMAKCGKSLHFEVKRLRLLKRRLIRETTTLKRRKQKLLNQIHQLE